MRNPAGHCCDHDLSIAVLVPPVLDFPKELSDMFDPTKGKPPPAHELPPAVY